MFSASNRGTFTWRDIVLILVLFLATRAGVFAAGAWANANLPANDSPELKRLLDGGPALDMWYRWDAGFYATIATYGYDWYNEQRPAEDMAFLPLYPGLIRLVMNVTGCGFSPYLSTCATVGGLVVSHIALLAACFLLFDLAAAHTDRPTAWRALILLLISPNAIFLGGVYTEALFLAFVLATFWLLARGRFGPALLFASLAALTRSVGIALYPALLWYAWHDTHGQSSSLRMLRLAAAHAPLIAFAGYVVVAGLTVGDPRAYFSSYEVIWGRDVTRAPWETLLAYFSGEQVSLVGWRLSWIDLVAFVAFLSLAISVLRQKTSWGLFALFAVLVPFASGTLTGMPRFGAVIFPFYIALAAWCRPRWREALVYAVSATLALVFIARFVTLRWIA